MDHSLNVTTLAVVAACFVLWGLVSARLERWEITAPIAFVVFGLVVTHGPIALIHLQLHSSTIRAAAELTLAVVLFSDACRVNARQLLADVAVPARLLGIGLPLTIGAGTALAAGLFSSAGIWVAATIGAIVAPTDAALGASLMSDNRVPARVRRILNVESGLNDGIATPFVNLFLAGALATESISGGGAAHALVDLLGGAALGVAIGLLGALLLTLASRTQWSEAGFRPILVFSLALFSYATALVSHTNGFVAAFVAGIAFGTVFRDRGNVLLQFSEEAGTFLSLSVWFAFGAVMLVPGLEAADWKDLVFAVLALSVARMAPVAIALAGTNLDRKTVAFIGWFGPRGLASIVFGLIAVDTLAPPDAQFVLGAVVVTVALSVLLHGISASPLVARYAASAGRIRQEAPEHASIPGLPTRSLHRRRPADPDKPTSR